MCVCPDFPKGFAVAFFPASLKEVRDALEEEHVVVVVSDYRDSRSIVVEAYCLEDGEGVCEDAKPLVVLESG